MKKHNIIKICAGLICIPFCLTGCQQKETYDNYSIGLTNDGYYQSIEQNIIDLPKLTGLEFTYDNVLSWGVDYLKTSQGNSKIETIDDYINEYGNELLHTLELTSKDTVEVNDIVTAELEFKIDDKTLEDYGGEASYYADSDGDAITKSFEGHKKGDTYSVEYVFPDDDKYYAGKTATVNIEIKEVVYGNPMETDIVENNLEALSEYMEGVTDKESFKEVLRVELAKTTLIPFIENYLQEMSNIEVPQEYIDYEIYRLKSRLSQLGIEYDDYVESMDMTYEDVTFYCTQVAKENYLVMLFAKNNSDMTMTEDEVTEYYEDMGADLDTLKEIQGTGYITLAALRDKVIEYLASQTTLVENENTSTGDSE